MIRIVKSVGLGLVRMITRQPFHREELIARIHAIIRRSKGYSQSVIWTGKVGVHLDIKTVAVDGKTAHLIGKEYQVLESPSLRKGKH